MMKSSEFVKKLLEVLNYKTCYASGTFGQSATPGFIDQKARQYPKWYTLSRISMLKALPDDTKLFDCVGLIKGVMWGFPNMVYKSNGVPDVSDQGMWDMCNEKSEDFSNIKPGELLWMKGHVGVYIGEGKGIECTTSWDNKVQITAVSNINAINGLHSRKWTGHGKLPFIDYSEITFEKPVTQSTKKTNEEIAKEVIDGKWGNSPNRKTNLTKAGYDYNAIQKIVNDMVNKKPEEKAEYHIVKKDESLSQIARKYGTTWQKLMHLNNIKNPNLVFPGERLKVK